MRASAETESLRIGELSRQSGISKELIHHYLRQGLLPPPARSARYGTRHLRLLRWIKRLREERFLPLPVIRQLADAHGHDPERLELLLLSGPDPGTEGALVSLDELCVQAGIDSGTAASWVELGLLRPTADDGSGPRRFGQREANVAALVRRGLAMGIPVDSFRTIRSYVEIAFELERSRFLPPPEGVREPAELARDLAARRDLAGGFVQNVLHSQIEAELRRWTDATRGGARTPGCLEAHCPSDAFLRKHGLADEIARLREKVRADPADPRKARTLVRLLASAGRHREAAFSAERHWPALRDDPECARLLGWSLVLAGEAERGTAILLRAHRKHPRDAVAAAWLAAARLQALASAPRPLEALGDLGGVVEAADAALSKAARASAAEAAEARATAGWVLASLPAGCGRAREGIAALELALAASAADAEPAIRPEVERVRLRLRAAVLLRHVLLSPALPPAGGDGARREELAREILCLDPASDVALRLFAEPDEHGGPT